MRVCPSASKNVKTASSCCTPCWRAQELVAKGTQIYWTDANLTEASGVKPSCLLFVQSHLGDSDTQYLPIHRL
jgi:hypothetical protein